MIRRRTLLSCLSHTVFAGRVASAVAASEPHDRISAGAIRWDAWDATGPVNEVVAETLGPAKYHARAPFCAQPLSASAISFAGCDRQAVMDAEIAFASRAGLSYWAYVWYDMKDSMMNAWKLHQASALRERMNWCVLMRFGQINDGPWLVPHIPIYVAQFQQSNYEKVLGNRPLLYVYMYNYQTNGGSTRPQWAAARDAFDPMGAACQNAGLGRPYIVVMDGLPSQAAQLMRLMGGDAISNYVGGWPRHMPESYSDYDADVRKFWTAMSSTGFPIVPICMTGWDPRPRLGHPVPWQHSQKPDPNSPNFVEDGSPAEIAANIAASVGYVQGHPKFCPAQTILIYSWNECDEGGSALVPGYKKDAPNDALLNAVSRALRDEQYNTGGSQVSSGV